MKPPCAITIRPQMIKDAAAFYRILNEGNFDFFPVTVKSVEAEKRFLRQSRIHWQKQQTWNFTIMLGSKVVGAIGIIPEKSRSYNAEIGYFIDREQHGHGFALQAAIQVEQFALIFCPQIKRLQAFIVVENTPSIKVIEKAGYHKEGRLQSYLKCGDKYLDAYIYGKIIR
ncbi:MAG: GNAT family N-acetyltransferase [Candidatus Riflebacteria bacterium]|nr:GNAT family N-acetyltransferase [Candidatus Riflebacteria bacterium]